MSRLVFKLDDDDDDDFHHYYATPFLAALQEELEVIRARVVAAAVGVMTSPRNEWHTCARCCSILV